MRHLLLFFVLVACAVPSFAKSDRVTIDKETCTITKDGKTYPLYGNVRIVESGSYDLSVEIVESGSSDILVRLIEYGSASCGEWRVIDFGSADLTIRIFETGGADLTVRLVDGLPGIK